MTVEIGCPRALALRDRWATTAARASCGDGWLRSISTPPRLTRAWPSELSETSARGHSVAVLMYLSFVSSVVGQRVVAPGADGSASAAR